MSDSPLARENQPCRIINQKPLPTATAFLLFP